MTFEQALKEAVRRSGLQPRKLAPGECWSPAGKLCRLCWAHRLDYDSELSLKRRALDAWWTHHLRATPVAPLRPADPGRHYRSVSKRKAFGSPRKLGLLESERQKPFEVGSCAIEPENHAALFRQITKRLQTLRKLGEALSYVILKEHRGGTALILNVTRITGPVMAEAKRLTKNLKELTSAFLFQGKPGSSYYLEGTGDVERIFGKPTLYTEVAGKRFEYSPLAFSQVHHGMLDILVAEAAQMLALTKQDSFLDLYCGYGLFAVSLGSQAARTIGIEASQEAVASARGNARKNRLKARFLQQDIKAGNLQLDDIPGELKILLDPPRGGPARGVIEALAQREPAKVVHLFCDVERVPQDLAAWRKSGYIPMSALPLDLFPGTPNLEVMVGLVPKPSKTVPVPRRKASARR